MNVLSWFKKKKTDDGFRPARGFNHVVGRSVVKQETRKLWQCVSMSRSQFEDHYIKTIKNIAFYMQDEKAFNAALCNATNALQETMVNRLPYDRPREEGAKYEQVWKYTMFCCYLLREASKLNRRWHDKNGVQVLFLGPSNYQGLKFDEGPSHSEIMLMCNLHNIIPECASQWILQDNAQCFYEISKAAYGQPCFIDPDAEEPETEQSVNKTLDSKTPNTGEVDLIDRISSKMQVTAGPSETVTNRDKVKKKQNDETTKADDVKAPKENPSAEKKKGVSKVKPAEKISKNKRTNDKPTDVKALAEVMKKQHDLPLIGAGVQKVAVIDETVTRSVKGKTPKDNSTPKISTNDFTAWVLKSGNLVQSDTSASFAYPRTLEAYKKDRKSEFATRKLRMLLEKDGYEFIADDLHPTMNMPEKADV